MNLRPGLLLLLLLPVVATRLWAQQMPVTVTSIGEEQLRYEQLPVEDLSHAPAGAAEQASRETAEDPRNSASGSGELDTRAEHPSGTDDQPGLDQELPGRLEALLDPNTQRRLLGVDLPPATTTRLTWNPSNSFSGMALDTPVLVVNGAFDGPAVCLTAAIHGDELNGIEMVRQVVHGLEPGKLHGIVVGVPIVNLMGFSRNSRYLPDRRDLNRYFPGNPSGSAAARIAAAFFNDIVRHCDSLVDLHTGSFYRTNIPQLRADMNNPQVVRFVEMFGDIPVLHSRGNSRSLRAAATRAGIPTVTLEAGEPMRLQRDMVEAGVATINTLLAKSGMYSKREQWTEPEPAFYDSTWVRANASGILFSRKALGDEVLEGDVLGAVNNPITNEQMDIVSPLSGRILGMALDQFVMPGYAVYHIGIQAAKETLIGSGGKPHDEAPPSVEAVDALDGIEDPQEMDAASHDND